MSHPIEIRKIPFEFSDDIAPVWNAKQPEWSHMVNGASLAMPYLEPFLIKNLREAQALIEDPDLIEDIRLFVGQEAQHYTNHRRYNEMLKRHGYPQLADVEASMTQSYKRLSSRSLEWRLAYTAGFETMTMGLTHWLIAERESLFQDADPVVTSLVLWHMVEEMEHKSVAFDVFQAVSGSFWLRLWGLVYGSMHVGLLSRRGYMAMLKQDGRWHQWRSRLALWRMVCRFFLKVAPSMLQASLPSHHPDSTEDPVWVDRWRSAYTDIDADHLPLLDTRCEAIEPVFGYSSLQRGGV
ncbi:MAG: metal-dependent hydrolase [Pseudomonadales bacterium]|jgi:predicted metal-dependent hydrolase|nr:metal-dependent hydrolase [Pseudomonadales bacterium]